MRGSLGLILAICYVSGGLSLRLWEDGQEYYFQEESGVHVSSRDVESTASGLRMMSDVKIQVQGDKLIVTIDNMKEAHYQQTFPENMWPYTMVKDQQSMKHYQDIQKSRYLDSIGYENGNTFIMTLENGLVKNIELPSKLSTNGKNMMRALASILQMDIKGRDKHTWKTRESSIHGDCGMEYSLFRGERKEIWEMTKSMSQFMDCKIRNFRTTTNTDYHTCQARGFDWWNDKFFDEKMSDEQMESYRNMFGDKWMKPYYPEPMLGSSMTTFIMKSMDTQSLQVQKIFSTGATMIQRFGVKGPTFATVANRTLTLVKQSAIGSVAAVQDPVQFQDLHFEWMEDELEWNADITIDQLKEKRSMFANGYFFDETQERIVEELTKKIKDHVVEMHTFSEPTHNREETIRKLHENSLKTLYPFFTNLDYNSLTKMKEYYMGQNPGEEHFMAMRNVFLEMLPFTGTYPAALVVYDMVLNNDLDCDISTAKLLVTLPFHMQPTKALVDEFYKLVTMKNTKSHLAKPLTKRAIDLAYAHFVKRACIAIETGEECFKALHIEDFFKRFERLAEDDTKEQKHMMNVFKNFMHSDMLEDFLVPIVKNTGSRKYSSDVRTFAVYALTQRAIVKGHEIDHFLTLFLRRDETHELRIAAFDALIQGRMMTTTTMDKIMTHMMWDKDMEVFNYVYTTFEKMEKMYNEPCGKEYRRYAEYFLKYWRQNMWTKPQYSFGLSKSYSNFYTNPMHDYSGAIEMRTIGYHRTAAPLSFQIDFTSQSYNHVNIREFGLYVRMEGVSPRIMDKIKSMTWLGQLKVDELQQLLMTEMQIRHRSDIPAKFDITFFKGDSIVLCYHMNDQEIMSFIDNYKRWFYSFKSFNDLFTLNNHFGFTWHKFKFEMPTDFGVPMVYSRNSMSMMGLEGEYKKQTFTKGEFKFHTHLHTFNEEDLFFIHPDQKIRFALQKSVVFKHQLKTGFMFNFDWFKQKLEFSMIVPEKTSPFSWMMHSKVFMYSSENKIAMTQNWLTKSCPKCETHLIVSKGKDKRRNMELLEGFRKWTNIYGLDFGAKWFDCELPEAVSTGLYFQNFYLHSLSPMNKEPKHFFNLLLSGTNQFFAYLFHWPRAESCGFNVLFHKSTTEPTKMINFAFDLKKWTTIERPRMFWKETFIAMDVDFVLRGFVDRATHMEFNFNIDPTWSETKFDFDFKRLPFTYNGKTYEEWPLTITMRTKPSPKRNNQPYLMKDLMSSTKYRMKTYTSIVWDHDHKITIEGDHKTTMEAADFIKATWYYRQCMREKESPEWKTSATIPATDACMYSMLDMMTFRHYTWDIKATKLAPWMVNTYRRMGTMMKSMFYPFWSLEAEYTPHQITPSEPMFHIETVFRPKMKMMDMLLRHDKDVSRFRGIRFDYHWMSQWMMNWQTEPYQRMQNWWMMPLPFWHTSYVTPETFKYMLMNQHIAKCTLSKDTLLDKATVRTYDNVTYTFTKEDHCWTLLTADCVESPTFAVFYKMDKTNNKMSVMMMFGNTQVEFVPTNTEGEYKIYLKGNNGKQGPFELRENDFMFVSDKKETKVNAKETDYIFKIMKNSYQYLIDFYPQMMMVFDGNYMTMLAWPQIRGTNCGMCGDYNRNTFYELKDPMMCPLRTGDEMVAAWTLDSKWCETKVSKPSCQMPFTDKILY